MSYSEKLSAFLSTCDGKVINVLFEAYCLIESIDIENQPAALMYFCEHVFKTASDQSNKIEKEYYTSTQIEKAEQKIRIKFRPSLDELILNCSQNSIPPQEFYAKAWALIQSSVFKTKRERAFALFSFVDHELIPYRSVGIGLTMENDSYTSIVDTLAETVLDDMDYILKMDYDQKTQRASLLLDKLLSLNNKEEQTVFLALLMNTIESNVRDSLKASLERS